MEVRQSADLSGVVHGRAGEIGQVAAALVARRPVVVVGEAGIGKTAVLRAAAGPDRFEGGGFATLSWMDYLPLRRALGRPVPTGDIDLVAGTVEAAVGPAGILLIDDAHWCDPGTRAVLVRLAGRIPLATAVRQGDPNAQAVLTELSAAGFVPLELGPLPDADAVRIARARHAGLSDAGARRLVRRAGGNPLIINELAPGADPSPSLQRALAARLRSLPVAIQQCFTALALVGRPLPVSAVADALEALVDAGLVSHIDSDHVEVRHALLGEVAIEALSPEERAAAHRRAAALVDDDGERARHLAAAGDTMLARDLALVAAAAALAPGERGRHLLLAARCTAGVAADDLRLAAARALFEAADFVAVEAALRDLDEGTAHDAEVALLRGRVSWETGDDEGARTALTRGLAGAAGSGSETEVRLQIELTRLPLFVDGDYDAAVTNAKSALALARRRNVAVAAAELMLGSALGLAARPGWEHHLGVALEEARRTGEIDVELRAANNLVAAHEASGDPELARTIARTAIERARAIGQLLWERQFRAMAANLDGLAGHYDEALAEAEALLTEALQPRTRDQVGITRALALIDLGRFEDAGRQIDDSDRMAAPDPIGREQFRYLRAEIDLWAGRLRAAATALDALIERVGGDFDIATFAHLARMRARGELGLDQSPPCPPRPTRFFAALPSEQAAWTASGHGDFVAASESFHTAAALWAPYHFRSALYCRWAAAESMRRAGELDATQRLEELEAAADARGMVPLLMRIRASLRRAGRRSGPRRSPGAGPLTAAELDVLTLVSQGLTNAEIAARLNRSRRTVETQVASAVGKLGARTRLQAAALAAR